MPLTITCTHPRPIRTASVRKAAYKAMQLHGVAGSEVNIRLVDDNTIHSLNSDYRHVDRATDVLSFAARDHSGSTPHFPTLPLPNEILGDIVISLDTSRRQATAHGVPEEHEVALLAVHGILHLIGMDDTTTSGAGQMRVAERIVLKLAGIYRHPLDYNAETGSNAKLKASSR